MKNFCWFVINKEFVITEFDSIFKNLLEGQVMANNNNKWSNFCFVLFLLTIIQNSEVTLTFPHNWNVSQGNMTSKYVGIIIKMINRKKKTTCAKLSCYSIVAFKKWEDSSLKVIVIFEWKLFSHLLVKIIVM